VEPLFSIMVFIQFCYYGLYIEWDLVETSELSLPARIRQGGECGVLKYLKEKKKIFFFVSSTSVLRGSVQ
jgi:hypothetical protein